MQSIFWSVKKVAIRAKEFDENGIEKLVPVLAAGYKPLIVTSLMGGYHLEIDFQDNGLVSL